MMRHAGCGPVKVPHKAVDCGGSLRLQCVDEIDLLCPLLIAKGLAC